MKCRDNIIIVGGNAYFDYAIIRVGRAIGTAIRPVVLYRI
jgi:hypothetical protein